MKAIRIISLILWVVGIVAWFTMPWLSIGVGRDEIGITALDIATNPFLSDFDLITEGDSIDTLTFLVFGFPCYFSALILLSGFFDILGRKCSICRTNIVLGGVVLFGFISFIGYFPEAMPFLASFIDVSTPAPVFIGCMLIVQFVLSLLLKRLETPATVVTPPKAITPPTAPNFQPPVVQATPQQTAPYNPALYQEAPVANTQTEDYWVCGHCKTKNLNLRTDCWSCGAKK